MIRTTVKADTTVLDDIMAVIATQNEVIADIGGQVYREYAPQALAELQQEPGEPSYPIAWTSEKQRKYVMAMLRKQDNIPYNRTHELSQEWTIKDLTNNGIFIIVIENPAPEAKYVYGSLAQDRTRAMRWQQQFHVNTRWQTASDTATKWTDVMRKAFKLEYERQSGGLASTKRRAYTR